MNIFKKLVFGIALIGYEEFEFYAFRDADVQWIKLLVVKIRDEHNFGQRRLFDHDRG